MQKSRRSHQVIFSFFRLIPCTKHVKYEPSRALLYSSPTRKKYYPYLNQSRSLFGQNRHYSTGVQTRTHYEVLEVPKSATQDDIKKAYRKLALQWHPDRNQGSQQKLAEAKFREASESYEILSDPQKRREYDMSGGGVFNDFKSPRENQYGHMTDEEARDIFRQVFGDFLGGQRMAGSFGLNEFESIFGTSKKAPHGFENYSNANVTTSSTIFVRDGRLIEKRETLRRTRAGTQRQIEEIDLGPANQNPNIDISSFFKSGNFSQYPTPPKQTKNTDDLFSLLELLLRQVDRNETTIQDEPKIQTRRRFDEVPSQARQSLTRFNPETIPGKIEKFVYKAWHSPQIKEVRFLVRLSIYNVFIRMTSKFIETTLRILVRNFFRRTR